MASDPVDSNQDDKKRNGARDLRLRLMRVLERVDAREAYKRGGKTAVAQLVLKAFQETGQGSIDSSLLAGEAEEALIVGAIQEAGVEVKSLSDLARKPDPRAVSVLVEYLPKVEDRGLKLEIINTLAAKEARGIAARPLIEEFLRVPREDWDLRWAIGDALSSIADDSVFDEIAQLALDKENGRARQMVLVALGRMKNPRAVDVLIELLDDEEVSGHAVVALGRLRASKALPRLKEFLGDPRTWVRQKAKRAIANIEKAEWTNVGVRMREP